MMDAPAIIEPIAARTWPPAETGWLGGWRLNASSGFSGRINACWPLGDAGLPEDAAIDAVEAWYRARGLAAMFKLCDGPLAERLAARGYAWHTLTWTLAGPLTAADAPGVELLAAPDARFEQVFVDPAFGAPDDAAERLAALKRVPAPRAYALVMADGAPAAIGATAALEGWAGIMVMRTAPQHRRRGLARQVFRALCGFAARNGAARGFLQVEAENHSAIALYRSEGFGDAYQYRYWVKSPPP